MKFMAFQAVAASLMLLAGCAGTAKTSAEVATVAKEERCQVTGITVPKRDCRGDVTILPP